MTESPLIGLATIIVLGISAQWLAWRLRLPSILLMLTFGVLAGPVARAYWPAVAVDPDQLLGTSLLMAIVSAAVGVILFEGGLTLKLSELVEAGGVVARLVSIGAVASWLLSAAAARFILGFDVPLALVFGAILTVTGPTVILPLLRQVRPRAPVNSILKWEGIAIDPVGAALAVLVFEAMFGGHVGSPGSIAVVGILRTIFFGALFGFTAAAFIVVALRRYWIPDYLHSPVTLMMVVGTLAASNCLQHESGLLAVTIMGVTLANQRLVSVSHILDFKRDLTIVLIAHLFILLAARLDPSDLNAITPSSALFLAVLILVVRPAGVWISTIGSKLKLSERVYLAAMAPRGIVAASVASVFGLQLAEREYAAAAQLAPLMFMVIVGTVAIYGLAAAPLARWLGLADPNPQGILLLGAHAWGRSLAKFLQNEGYSVVMLDTNRENVVAARLEGLAAENENILDADAFDELDLSGLGRLLALTSNDEVNSLAVIQSKEIFDRSELYQLAPSTATATGRKVAVGSARGRLLFNETATFENLSQRIARGAALKKTCLTTEFNYDAYRQQYGAEALLLFVIDAGRLRVVATDQAVAPKPGLALISLVSQAARPEGLRKGDSGVLS